MLLFFPPETKQSCQLTLPALPQLQRVAGAASSRQETSRQRQELWGEAWDSCSAGSCAKRCLESMSSHRSRERLIRCLCLPPSSGPGSLEPWQPGEVLGTWAWRLPARRRVRKSGRLPPKVCPTFGKSLPERYSSLKCFSFDKCVVFCCVCFLK